ncbi:MAG TPA: hypothetical protein PKE16_15830 [Hyphomicrobium sp.]|nr:hypothetical protein [Hyphomicrobium sp.]
MRLKATRATLLALSTLPILAATSVAEPSSSVPERFTMSPVDGGFLRLDKQTGAVAMCAKSGMTWACKPVEDQTASASENKLSRLEAENRELKDRLKELEDLVEARPPGAPPLNGPAVGEGAGGKAQLPTDEEVDQALDYISRVYKKIRDHVRDLDRPLPPDEHAAPPPAPPAPPAAAPAPKGAL